MFAAGPGESSRPAALPPHSAWRVVSLLRSEEPLTRSAQVGRQVLEIVSTCPAGCTVNITVGRLTPRTSGMRIDVWGPVPATFAGDVRWAFADTAELVPTRARAVAPPRGLAEVVADRSLTPWAASVHSFEPPRDPVQAELLRQRSLKLQTPWPRPRYADLADLLVLDEGPATLGPGLIVRYRLAPAGPVDSQLVAEAVHHHWDPEHGDAHEYVGHPVRMRAFVGSRRGALPGRAHAVVRRWASGLDLRDVAPEDIEAAWSGDALSLSYHAVPVGHAMALLRLPAAVQSFPGLPTAEPPVRLRPLDPVPPTSEHGLRLGRARTAGGAWTDVQLGTTDLLQHLAIQGATGSGKTTIVGALCHAVQAAGASYTLLDPDGKNIDTVLANTDRAHVDAVSVIRHGAPELDAPLNLLAAAPDQLERMLDMFAEMIQRAQDPDNKGMVGPRWKRWFTLIARATVLVLGADANLVAVAAIASDMDRVRELAKAVRPHDAEIAHRLESEYGRLGGENAADMVSWGVSKLGALLGTEKARWVFGAGPDAVDVRAAMDEGMSLLVDLGAHRLGEPVGRVIGVTYLLKFWAALGLREHPERPHFVIVDEAHLFSYGPLPKLLAEARKFGVGVVIATQHIGQLTGELGDALESNTGSFISLRAGLQSASRASARLEGWPVTELVRLPNLTAAATLIRDGVATAPFSLVVDHHDRMRKLARAGRIGPDVRDQVLAACRSEVAAAYADLTAPTDDRIFAALRRRPEPPQPPPTPPGRPAPSRTRDPRDGEQVDDAFDRSRRSSIVDDWLAQRGQASD